MGFVLRFIMLLFLASLGLAFGRMPPSELNAFGQLMAIAFFLLAPALYLLPTYEAWTRRHPSTAGIFVVNLFLGWTLLGWVASAAWALNGSTRQVVEIEPEREMKVCPYCAEEVLVEARKCKHCGSALPLTSPGDSPTHARRPPDPHLVRRIERR